MTLKYFGVAIAFLIFFSTHAAEHGGDHDELVQRLDQIASLDARSAEAEDMRKLERLNADLASFIDNQVQLATERRTAQLRQYATLVEGSQAAPPYMCGILCHATCGDGFNRVQAEASEIVKACKDYVNANKMCGEGFGNLPTTVIRPATAEYREVAVPELAEG